MMCKTAHAIAVFVLPALCSVLLCAQTDKSPLLTLEQYQSEISALQGRLDTLREHPEAAQEIRDSLPENYSVEANGRSFEVSSAPISASLGEFIQGQPQPREGILRALRQRLLQLQQGAADFALAPDFGSARQRLDGILSRREFAQVHIRTPWDDLRDRFNQWLDQLVSRLFGGSRATGRAGQVVVWIAIVAAIILLLVRSLRLARSRIAEGLFAESVAFAPSSRHWSRWLAEARSAAGQGMWRDAIHLAYWAAVSHLEESGAWVPDQARTPREYLQLLREAKAERPAFTGLTHRFELTWYGGRPAQEADFRDVLASLEALGCH